jgi:CRISP-associated protein Cas1
VHGGVLYFAGSRERVPVEFDEALVARTVDQARQMRTVAEQDEIPPPLVDSPKCPRCSLVGICLPDEVRFLSQGAAASEVRPLAPARDDALPLHVQHQGARIQKDGGMLRILDADTVIGEARLAELSQVVLFGGVHITTPTIHELCRREIPVTWLSHGGWFYGITHGMLHKNVELRRRQYAVAADGERALALAGRFVQAKIANCRTLLRRNHPDAPAAVLRDLKEDIRRAGDTDRMDVLLGIEGVAAHRYFSIFGEMLRAPSDELKTFDFQHRNRRPPRSEPRGGPGFPRRRRRGPIEGTSLRGPRAWRSRFHGGDAVAQLKGRPLRRHPRPRRRFHGGDAVAQLKGGRHRRGPRGGRGGFHGGDAVAQLKDEAVGRQQHVMVDVSTAATPWPN